MAYRNPEDYRAWCEANRDDLREYRRAYRAKNIERISKVRRDRYWSDSDAARAATMAYQKLNKEQVAQRARERRLADPDKTRTRKQAEYRKHREAYLARAGAYRAVHDARLRDWFRIYRATRREYYRERTNAWHAANPGRSRAHRITRRPRERGHTPAWVDYRALNEVYLVRPVGLVVDHIVPLRGRTAAGWPVSGLHVPWNLQYLSADENHRKKNRMRAHETCVAMQS